MKNFWNNAKAWLNAHPKVKGAIIVAEGAALGAVQDSISAYFAGTHMTFKGVAAGVSIAVYLAVKNYAAQNAGWSAKQPPQLPPQEEKRNEVQAV